MRISRLFVEQALQENEVISLESGAAHYLRNVLRLKKGFELTLFNGKGGEFSATVELVSRKEVTLNIGQWRDVNLESALSIVLGLSVSRGERMDVAIQKATELGVSVITPILTQHCVVKLNEERRLQRHQHWQNIIYRACEQCGRNIPPRLNVPIDLAPWLIGEMASSRIIFEPGKKGTLKSFPKPEDQVAVLIGPEGGFSEQEVVDAEGAGFTALGFGPRVIRNETAAIASVAAMQVLWGDLA